MNRRRTKGDVNPKSAGILAGITRKHHRVSLPNPKPAARTPIRRASFPHRVARGVSVLHVLMVCLIIFSCAGAYVYHLHVRFEGVRLGYEVSQEQKVQTRLMLERRELRLELASLKEQKRIEQDARTKIGMEVPDYDRIIPVSKKRKVVSVSGGAL